MENQKFKHEEALRTLKAEISKDGEQNGNGKRKAVQNNEKNVEIIVKWKKEDKKEKEQKILEGIERYILSKIPETKYFTTYNDWFRWISSDDVGKDELAIFDNCIFLKSLFVITAHFTETEHFPIDDNSECVIPVIGEGWSLKNTKCLHLMTRGFMFSQKTANFEEIQSTSTEKLEKPGFGRYFSFMFSNCKQNDSNFGIRSNKIDDMLLLVFIKDEH